MKKLFLIIGFLIVMVSAFSQRWNYYYNTTYKDSVEGSDPVLFLIQDGDSTHAVDRSTLDSLWDQGAEVVALDTRIEITEDMLQDSLGLFNVTSPDYGADKTGATDATAGIQAALTACAVDGGVLYFPPGLYKITDAISQSIEDSINIKILGYGAKIDATAISSYSGNGIISLYGSTISNGSMSAVASMDEGDTEITTVTDLNISAGDVLRITSTDLFNPSNAAYYAGELVKVESVSNDTVITLTKGLYDTYTPANVTLYTESHPTVSIEGLELEADMNTATGIALYHIKNPEVRNCKIHGARYTGVIYYYCSGGIIDNNYMYDNWYSGTGTSYNVMIASSQNVVVKDNDLYEARRNISTGGSYTVRDVQIKGNNTYHHISEAGGLGIGLHGNAEHISIVENYTSGMRIICPNVNVTNNTVRSETNNIGLITFLCEMDADYYIVKGNILRDVKASSNTTYGVYVVPTEADVTINNLTISNNDIIAGYTAFYIVPQASGDTGFEIEILNASNNIFKSYTGPTFYLNKATAAIVTITDFMTSGNVYKSIGSGANAFQAIASSNIVNLYSTGDKFFAGADAAYLFNLQDSSCSNIRMNMPEFRGLSAADDAYIVRFGCDSIIEVHDALYVDIASGIHLGVNADLYIEDGKRLVNASSTVNNSGDVPHIVSINGSGLKFGYATAAPTTNTWAVGDWFVDPTPVAGQAKGWKCTVAGTPGTWVSTGNL